MLTSTMELAIYVQSEHSPGLSVSPIARFTAGESPRPGRLAAVPPEAQCTSLGLLATGATNGGLTHGLLSAGLAPPPVTPLLVLWLARGEVHPGCWCMDATVENAPVGP